MKTVRSGVEVDGEADAVLVIPPPSPSDTNPPLGPAIIARAAERAGFKARVIDLNALHIRRFRWTHPRRNTMALGDHGKDRPLVAHAASVLYRATGLYEYPPDHLPEGADPVAGMHYSSAVVSRAVLAQSEDGSWWDAWLTDDLFGRFRRPPRILGVSIMGASQVFPALVVLALAKKRWLATVTVAGGSHITLLADNIRKGLHAGTGIDFILPGHSEESFVELLRGTVSTPADPASGVSAVARDFEYFPLFPREQVDLYRNGNTALPLQFTRGCAYARCTFCTYPAVEPVLTRFDPDRARAAVTALAAEHGIRTFSVKDSLFTVPMLESFAGSLLTPGTPSVRWSATTKVNGRLAQVAPMLAESGLVTLELGVESISSATQRLFDKQADLAMIEHVIQALTRQGVFVVINLIFGAPGETLEDAERQLAWYMWMRDSTPGHIDGSLNLLEIVRGSPMERRPPPGVRLSGVAPWAYCYKWNAPSWRTGFQQRLLAAELAESSALQGLKH